MEYITVRHNTAANYNVSAECMIQLALQRQCQQKLNITGIIKEDLMAEQSY